MSRLRRAVGSALDRLVWLAYLAAAVTKPARSATTRRADRPGGPPCLTPDATHERSST